MPSFDWNNKQEVHDFVFDALAGMNQAELYSIINEAYDRIDDINRPGTYAGKHGG